MNRFFLLCTRVFVIIAGLSLNTSCRQELSPASTVDPFIGTGGHGHTFPGATVPFGMVQLSPDTRLEGWDGCSGYHYSDSVIYGFSHTHLSGTGCSDYGDILIMPVNRNVSTDTYEYRSPFRKKTEYARAGYYRVTLDTWGVNAELTATARTGMHRYTFRPGDTSAVVIDLVHRDQVIESGLEITGDREVTGYRFSKAWAANQMVYFVARFSKPIVSYSVACDSSVSEIVKNFQGDAIRGIFFFPAGKEPLIVKVGLSAVSVEGARQNLIAENPGWDFDAVRDAATYLWNREMAKINVSGGSPEQRSVFYSALYHLMIQPNLYIDTDRRYRGRDLQVHKAEDFDYYTVFSLWDTYRAAHPLITIIDEKRTTDFIQTFIRQYREGGMLPVWELSSNETGCMIGYHAIPVIADAWMKGIRGFDTLAAYEAMKHSAMQDHLGLSWYKAKGYIPGDMEGESVSKTLEYAYDDWCIATVAKAMGLSDDYRYFIRRAQNYRNLFDPSTGFMRAKMNETWFSPFDPAEVNFNYTEANAWQYSFYVPQDIHGLIELLGGKDRFAARLDSLFTADSRTTGRNQADITGLIGQYAHGNEPSHHMAYLYNYAGKPWKTQEMVHRICSELYTPLPDGLSGNEDCGQMSAWFIFSAMGFYPVTPASGVYAIGTPAFPETVINLENGKRFTIRARGLDRDHYYLRFVSLNGIRLDAPFLRHSDIMNGGDLLFEMSDIPEPGCFSDGKLAETGTGISEERIEPLPFVVSGNPTFFDSTVVVMGVNSTDGEIWYSTYPATDAGKIPQQSYKRYEKPLTLSGTTTVTAFARQHEGNAGPLIQAVFQKIPANRKIQLQTIYAPQYSAGGDIALIDFRRGSENFRTGSWQGYEGVNLDATVDLGKVVPVVGVSAGFLQDQNSWIFMPEWVEFYLSGDGENFIPAGKIVNDVRDDLAGAVLKEFTLEVKGKQVRYIRVVAKNRGFCPSWHPGAGSKAWIFADEIIVK